MKTVTTPKGTELPLVNLKGKDYLMVAYRLQWLVEEEKNFSIHTDFLHVDDTQTICKATVILKDAAGNVVKQACGTKRETKADFSDHTEKAETSAVGRALAMLGYGTQFAIADLDEGNRLADSPLATVKAPAKQEPTRASITTAVLTPSLPITASPATASSALVSTDSLPVGAVQAEAPKKSSFRKQPKAEAPVAASTSAEEKWE